MTWACPLSAAVGVAVGFAYGVWRTRRTVTETLRNISRMVDQHDRRAD